MNHQKLKKFIFQYGDKLFGEQDKTIDLPALDAQFSKIKSINRKRLEEIMVVIKNILDIDWGGIS